MFDRLKRFPLMKSLYESPTLQKAYHYSLAFLGALIYRFPSHKMVVIGVTGTKGKTTTTELINALFESAGKRTALLSSMRIKIGSESKPNITGNSMPGRFFIQKFLSDASREGCHYAIIEATSQGAVQYRHRFIQWRAAVLTNIAPEHIEAHGSFENYRDAKLLFLKKALKDQALVFINEDDKGSMYIAERLGFEHIHLYSKKLLHGLYLENPVFDGDFYKENAAAALSVARSLGVNEKYIQSALASFTGVPGRAEHVPWPEGREPQFDVVVDYAHTPDSLKAIYVTLGSNKRRLVCVLGAAGGGRDKWKRPAMGKVASEYCDQIILTNEDPYDEDPMDIINQVASGVQSKKVEIVLDRREAIKKAFASARKGDTVIITGKGSEEVLHVADGKTIPWNDKKVCEELLREFELRIISKKPAARIVETHKKKKARNV